ncbi:fimbrial protein [Serratia sp. NPDC078593]|uniref:fimbrial protein n=1 Tax=unclassified Serratia (in: enterobacteria) TaxID=2647522 RepID=UPI0037D3B9CF
MRNSIVKLVPVALLLLSVSGYSHAGTNAQIMITADVVAASCDVSLSTNNLDLGNYTPKAFTTVATPIADSVKPFTVGLNNCDVPLAAGDTASLKISGQALGGNPSIFNTTGTNTGIMLNLKGETDYIANGDKLQVATAGTTSADEFNSKTLSLEAGLASTVTGNNVDIGHVSAPILFSFVYN